MKINRIMLMDPPFYRFLNEEQRGVPLGAAYLSAALRSKGYRDVVIYNTDLDPHQRLCVANRGYLEEMNMFDQYLADVTNEQHPVYQEVVSTVVDYQPDFIGMSVRTAKFFIAKTVIHLIRQALPKVIIVVGGPHATANPDHVLERTEADFVARGEGEDTIVELIQALNRGNQEVGSVAGIGFRRNGNIVQTPSLKRNLMLDASSVSTGPFIQNADRPLISDIDTLRFPERDIILHSHQMTPNDFSNLFSSRGCPYGCTFCDSRATWTRQVRRHSPRYIVDEILSIKGKYGSSFFSFQDDIFVTDLDYTLAICEEMQKRGLGDLPKSEFRWWCEIHPHLVNEKVIHAMKEVNCVAAAIGGESGNQRTLKNIKKASSEETVRRASRIIQEAGLHLTMFIMIGFPWETAADIEETLCFMEDVQPDSPEISVLTPLPGTEIFEYCKEQGLINYDEDFLTLFHQRSSYFHSRLISDEASREIIRDAHMRADRLKRGARQRRILRFVQDRMAANFAEECGVELEIVEDIMSVTVDKLSQHGQGPHIGVNITENYLDEKLNVQFAGSNLSVDSMNWIGTQLLEEFPEYETVEMQDRNESNVQAYIIQSHTKSAQVVPRWVSPLPEEHLASVDSAQ
ncbi:B12-binding domain-containing radical SAM protein [Candidatus Nitronereus thalassa]|uniref:Radical SAM protein n=1 Tax=Candidatus Nitronereus thalassa TaxID=3020898 RepID=A0ABU3K680_9BACT|nr:radical SAM protein [Candidatus Nitronereus thalassa]MDT7041843.1 radical SAM protein [Candidatus Nitronereus thalassa]